MEAIWQYLLGGLGALLTIYARSEESIPAFRAVFDYAEQEKELSKIIRELEEARATRKQYSEIYVKKGLSDAQFDRLTKEIDDRISDNESLRRRLGRLVQIAQIVHRLTGFLVYIVLGGVFAGLLSNVINIEGVEGVVADAAKPLIIGATWTGYLSILGFRNQEQGRKEVEEKAAAVSNELSTRIDEMGRIINNLKSSAKQDEKTIKPEIGNLLKSFSALQKEAEVKLATIKPAGRKTGI